MNNLGLDVGKVKSWLKNNNWRTNSNLSADAKAFLTKIDGKLTRNDTDFGQFAEYLDDVNDALRTTREYFNSSVCGCGDELGDFLADRIRNSTGLDKAALAQDFKNSPQLINTFNDDPELLDTWKKYNDNSNKTDVAWLKDVKKNGYAVDYNSEPLSAFVFEARKNTEITKKGVTYIGDYEFSNYAVYEYKDLSGNLQHVVRKIIGANGSPTGEALHSEQLCEDFLRNQRIPNENVLRIYTERSPCFETINDCSGRIFSNYPNAKVTYTWKYGSPTMNSDFRSYMKTLEKSYQKIK